MSSIPGTVGYIPPSIEPTITWVPSGSLGTYGLTQKLCLKCICRADSRMIQDRSCYIGNQTGRGSGMSTPVSRIV